jgi:hypothetical protein
MRNFRITHADGQISLHLGGLYNSDIDFVMAIEHEGRGPILRRLHDIWEGEAGYDEVMEEYNKLPTFVLAIVVADTLGGGIEDWRRFYGPRP